MVYRPVLVKLKSTVVLFVNGFGRASTVDLKLFVVVSVSAIAFAFTPTGNPSFSTGAFVGGAALVIVSDAGSVATTPTVLSGLAFSTVAMI